MKKSVWIPGAALAIFLGWGLWSTESSAVESRSTIRLPWKQAGWTEREAAAHLLSRFSYGPRPGEIERALSMGLDRWLERQLAADRPDRKLDERLKDLPALDLPAAEIARIYPLPGRVLVEARRAGVIEESPDRAEDEQPDKQEMRAAALSWAREQGYRPQKELAGQLLAQKLWRAVESENQLQEVMTDFWFNHFNVSLTDNRSRPHVLSYERDVIRPKALGRVRDLLGSTARHPAMLLYLDNAQSTAASESRAARMTRMRNRGLNENYARELLELHTLGVDGGYTQKDVVEVARAFTGWTVLPAGMARRNASEFLFRAGAHDAGEKVVLGRRLPAGRGIEDGEQVLDLLAAHPATARHLATKLAVRFVSDQPSKTLVDRLAKVYQESGGDTRRMLEALAESPEFWSREARGAKIKSPFELTTSALRATGARVEDPRATLRWIARMGQPLYAYQAPTGYPDRAEAWVNTGALLHRMNFALQLAAGRVPGVEIDLAALNQSREPESREDVLRTYAALLLPGRDQAKALAALKPLEDDPTVEQAVGVILGSPEFQRR